MLGTGSFGRLLRLEFISIGLARRMLAFQADHGRVILMIVGPIYLMMTSARTGSTRKLGDADGVGGRSIIAYP